MDDLRLADLGYIVLALLLVALCFFLLVAIIVLFPKVVSSVSAWWRARMDEGRARRAYRYQVYTSAGFDRNGAGFAGGSERFQDAVPSQQVQSEPFQFAKFQDFLASHNLTDDQAITILALMRRINGETYLSANKIRDIVGGADAEVKAKVKDLRPDKPAPPKHPVARLERPVKGW